MYIKNYSHDLRKQTERIGNQRKNWNHRDHRIVEIGLNCEESSRSKEACSHLDSSKRPSTDAGRKVSQELK